jgi:hypothetical protein
VSQNAGSATPGFWHARPKPMSGATRASPSDVGPLMVPGAAHEKEGVKDRRGYARRSPSLSGGDPAFSILRWRARVARCKRCPATRSDPHLRRPDGTDLVKQIVVLVLLQLDVVTGLALDRPQDPLRSDLARRGASLEGYPHVDTHRKVQGKRLGYCETPQSAALSHSGLCVTA